MKKETPENNKENQVLCIVTLVASAIAIIYLYKSWKKEQQKVNLLKEILRIKEEENNKLSWKINYS